ncbi:hypothetical protein WH06_04985 [Aeromonas salmonicida subsp. salmonicida]|nr:hypothetical protein WH06_04985 [Aeromonas salmonicida subsp. salmonicida]
MAAHNHEINLLLFCLNDDFVGGAAEAYFEAGGNGQGGDQLFQLGLGLAFHFVGDLDGGHVQDFVAVETMQLIHHMDQL